MRRKSDREREGDQIEVGVQGEKGRKRVWERERGGERA